MSEGASSDTASIHRAENLDVADWIEAKAIPLSCMTPRSKFF